MTAKEREQREIVGSYLLAKFKQVDYLSEKAFKSLVTSFMKCFEIEPGRFKNEPEANQSLGAEVCPEAGGYLPADG